MNDQCDEAKAWFDVAALRGSAVQLEHTPEGVAALVQRLRQRLPTLVVLKAVGRAVRAARVAAVDSALATTG